MRSQMKAVAPGTLAAVAVAVAISVGADIAAASTPPVEAFGKVPQVEGVTLSPSGKLLAWQDNTRADQAVLVFDLDAGKDKVRFGIDKGSKLRNVFWADDVTLLIEVSVTHTLRGDWNQKDEWSRVLSADLATGRTRTLLMDDESRQFVTGAELLALRTAQPNTVAMATWDFAETKFKSGAGTRLAGDRADSGWVYSAFSVDTRTGFGKVAAYGSQFTDDWVVDAQGVPVARADFEPQKRIYSLMARDGAGWRKLLTLDDETLAVGGVSADGRAILARGFNGRDRATLWSIPLDGSPIAALAEDPKHDVQGFYHDPLSGAAVGYFLGDSLRWLDKPWQTRHKAVEQAFPDMDARIVGRSGDFKRVVVMVRGPATPVIYYLVDFSAGKADIVGEEYPGLADVPLGELREITYASRDHVSIPAYVTLPRGVEARNLPLVVLPHGGPASRDYPYFDWWAQFLASRGYAVLQPQFRGSTGFGEEHRLAGHREWGGVMQDDVTDGVKKLIEQGLVDARRICIAGASYGGYSALAGAAFTPDLYACAISVNGVSDLPTFLAFKEGQYQKDSDSAYAWRHQLGSQDDPKLAARSPARSAATFKAPVLLLHGADDTNVPFSQAEKMNKALSDQRRPVKFVKLPGEDHWLSRSETRIQVLKETEAFLAEHLPVSAAAAAASGSASAPSDQR